jgi:type IX secretion system PorP/SprF family membrane protein
MRRVILLAALCMPCFAAIAQQDPLYSQYILNPFVLNPAYAGMTNNLNTSVIYRQQWTGFEGSPTTINANGHISLFANTMGAGLMVVSDKIGNTMTNEVYGSFAYRIRLTGDKTLSFGLQAGFVNYKTQNSKLTLQDPSDPLFNGETNASKPSIGAGIILSSDKFFIGLSVPRLLKTTTSVGGYEPTLYTQHLYAMGSYLFHINEALKFKPSVLAKVVSGAPVSVDLNAAIILYDKYTAGLLTRNFSTYGIFLQAVVKDTFRLGYTFEIPTNQSVGTNFLTHEITLGVRLSVLSFHNDGGIKF